MKNKSYFIEFENGDKGFYNGFKSKEEAKQKLGFNAGENIKVILTQHEFYKRQAKQLKKI